MKVGLFVDGDNLMMNGGFGIDYLVLREFAESHGTLIRANYYSAIDEEAEENPEVKRKRGDFRRILRSFGYHVFTKPVKKYGDVVKANVDLEMAVDILMQSRNLDYVLVCTGDGDFVRVVNAVQDMGRRVDALAFRNVSGKLVEEVDNFHNGYFIPGLISVDEGRHIGFMHHALTEKGFGFITMKTGFGRDDFRDDVFVHMKDMGLTSNVALGKLTGQGNPLEFSLETLPDGRLKAVNVKPVES